MTFFDFHTKIERSFSNKFIKIFGEPYLKLDTKDSKIIIKLTPGLGFGTGHHQTTKMML